MSAILSERNGEKSNSKKCKPSQLVKRLSADSYPIGSKHHDECKDEMSLLQLLALVRMIDQFPFLRILIEVETDSLTMDELMWLTNGIFLLKNALDLTAPAASDLLLKNRKNAWIQLSGHEGEQCGIFDNSDDDNTH